MFKFELVELKENLFILYPLSHLLAKTLAKRVINYPGYNIRAKPFFNTKIGISAIYIS